MVQFFMVVVKAAEQPAKPFSDPKVVPIRPDLRVEEPLFKVTFSITMAEPERPTPDKLFTSP